MRKKGIVIREMKEEDLPRVMEIECASFPTPWSEAMFRQQLLIDDISINLVLEAERTVAGYAISWIAYDEIHLLSIAVDPSMRRRGYGNELLNGVILRGKRAGACSIVLEVRRGNAAARSFYESRGFDMIGVRRRYYADTGEDAFIMERKIER